MISPQGFNDLGQFVGLAVPPLNQGGTFAYVVSPVPEPSSLALLILGAPFLIRRAHRRGRIRRVQ